MAYANKKDKTNYMRGYMRDVRSKAKEAKVNPEAALARERVEREYKIKNANDLLDVLNEIIGDVMNAPDADLLMRAKTVAQIVNVAIKCVEASAIEGRIKAIEDKLASPVVEVVDD